MEEFRMQPFNRNGLSHGGMGDATMPLGEWFASLTPIEREEPEIVANIGTQLRHMKLESLPFTARHLITTTAAALSPNSVVEVGSGIGHLASWLLDYWSSSDHRPTKFRLVESGSKFSVILNRIIERYEANEWCSIINSEWCEWVNQHSEELRGVDLAIVDVGWENQTESLMATLPLMSKNGILITSEPEVPLEGESDSVKIAAFNSWITLVRMLNETHELAFLPAGKTTLLAIRRK